jgi:hypothetical protein
MSKREGIQPFRSVLQHTVRALRDSDVSRIFWLNLCAHLQEGILEDQAVIDVLSRAWNDFHQVYGSTTLPQQGMAMLGCIINVCADNDTAVGSVSKLGAMQPGDIEELNVVLDGSLLWQYYLEADSESLTRALQNVPYTQSLHELEENQVGEIVLQHCWKSGNTNLLPLFQSLAKQATLQTRVKRLWTSLAHPARPRDPERLVQLLGIAAFGEGAWVIEMIYRRDQLKAALAAGDERFLLRPTAFCVNDVHAPRFRGLSRQEVGARRRGDDISPVGRTVDLAGWIGDGGEWKGEDGLPELMCPALQWQRSLLPTQVRLVGTIKKKLAGPSNEQFAAHLEALYRNASQTEAVVIDRLSTLAEAAEAGNVNAAR